jgi:hypothetical protein
MVLGKKTGSKSSTNGERKNSREQLKAPNRDPTKQSYKKKQERKQETQAGPVEQEPDEPNRGKLKSTSVELAARLPPSRGVQILNRNRTTLLQHLERVAASAEGLGFQF